MATYFGEVLPVLSRAVDEDDDLENAVQNCDARNKREVISRWNPDIKREISESDGYLRHSHLIFVVGHIPIAFIRRYVLAADTKPIGVISCGLDTADKNTVSQETLEDTSCFLYEIPLSNNGTALICIWNLKATAFQDVLAVDRLFTNLRTETEVTVLSSSHTTNYRRENVDESYDDSFVKCLATDFNDRTLPFSKLEAPNVVMGISAAVLSHCQVHGMIASLYVCYSNDDAFQLDSNTADIFLDLFGTIPFNKLQRLTATKEDGSRKTRKFNDTNLYT